MELREPAAAARLDRAAAAYADASRRRDDAAAELAEAMRIARGGGLSESEIARRSGVTRMTVRAWLARG